MINKLLVDWLTSVPKTPLSSEGMVLIFQNGAWSTVVNTAGYG